MQYFKQVLLLVKQLLALYGQLQPRACFLVSYMTLAIGRRPNARTIVLSFARAVRRAQR